MFLHNKEQVREIRNHKTAMLATIMGAKFLVTRCFFSRICYYMSFSAICFLIIVHQCTYKSISNLNEELLFFFDNTRICSLFLKSYFLMSEGIVFVQI